VRGLYHGRSFQQSISDIGGGTWLGISCVVAMMFILLIPFFAFTELRRGIGEGRMHELLFRSRQRLGGPSRNK